MSVLLLKQDMSQLSTGLLNYYSVPITITITITS